MSTAFSNKILQYKLSDNCSRFKIEVISIYFKAITEENNTKYNIIKSNS